ncbi:MAG: hypothetical protein KBH99_02350 [Syntrophobacteraceae bacterium]|nr:hypothetical protein [Syntrophobacteraceae bacterium]
MNRNLFQIRLAEVAWEDTRFAVPGFTSKDFLLESLHRYGILGLPWVWEQSGGRKVVVDGFMRLRWALESGLETVSCLVFDRNTPCERLIRLRVEEKLLGPPPNPAEKARLVHLLSRLSPEDGSLPRLFQALGISPRKEVLELWQRLGASGTDLLEEAASGGICERAALELARWDVDATREVLEWFRVLRCSASVQVEILERIVEIAEREKRDKIEVLRDPALRSFLSTPHQNHRQKTRKFREMLARRRFPRLHSRMDRFQEDVTALSLPEDVQLVPPRDFEGERWQIRLIFSSSGELAKGVKTAERLAQSGELEKVLYPSEFSHSPTGVP